MEHLGIDVHKRDSQVCVLGGVGEVVLGRHVPTQREKLAELLGQRPKARVLLEASTESEWVERCLEELGHEVVVADPNFASMYATRSRRVKTDKRDARRLAEANRLGAFRKAHRISDEWRQVRAQMAAREVLVRTRTRLINQVRAQLRQQGVRVGSGDAETFAQRVAALSLPSGLQQQVEALLKVLKPVIVARRSAERPPPRLARSHGERRLGKGTTATITVGRGHRATTASAPHLHMDAGHAGRNSPMLVRSSMIEDDLTIGWRRRDGTSRAVVYVDLHHLLAQDLRRYTKICCDCRELRVARGRDRDNFNRSRLTAGTGWGADDAASLG